MLVASVALASANECSNVVFMVVGRFDTNERIRATKGTHCGAPDFVECKAEVEFGTILKLVVT